MLYFLLGTTPAWDSWILDDILAEMARPHSPIESKDAVEIDPADYLLVKQSREVPKVYIILFFTMGVNIVGSESISNYYFSLLFYFHFDAPLNFTCLPMRVCVNWERAKMDLPHIIMYEIL